MPGFVLLEAAKKGIHLYLKDGQLAYKAQQGAVSPEMRAEIVKHKEGIIALLKAQGGSGSVQQTIVPAPRSRRMALSYAQQRLWLIDRIDGGSAHYNMPAALKLSGDLDFAALRRALSVVVERHESLRTVFAVGEDGQPYQTVRPAAALPVPLLDISSLAGAEQRMRVEEESADEAATPFDLAQDSMLRARLLRLSGREHVLLVTMHHIASDGWSMAVLINEFSRLYSAFHEGRDHALPPLPIQYTDYAHWQRQWLRGEVLEKQLDYWQDQLAGIPVVHGLPLDFARPAVQGYAGRHVGSHIAKPVADALLALCQAHGATLFMGLHAAFSVLLARYSNESDIVVGSPIANREQAEVAGLIGFFINTLVLRSDVSGNPAFTALLGQSRDTLLRAYEHQQVPFEQVVERLQPQRSLSHSPLFQVMLVLQNNEEGKLELPGLELEPLVQQASIAKYDLSLNIAAGADGLVLDWEYNIDLFEESTIERMARHFGRLLDGLVRAPGQSVYAVEMLDDAERQRLVREFNATRAGYPSGQCIHALFEDHARRTPDAAAVLSGDERLSYRALDEQANRLAHWLRREKNVGPDRLVGVCMARSPDMLVAMLAILKAGGAYVPLDPSYPAQRLSYMLADAQLDVVLTHSATLAATPVAAAHAVCLDDAALLAELAQLPAEAVQAPGLNARNLAYVIYTSGSTGNPKASLLAHGGLCNLAVAQRESLDVAPGDRILQFASAAFDAATWEWCMAFSNGATLVLVDAETARSPERLSAEVQRQGVTHATLTPVLLPMLPLDAWSSVRTLVTAGDACSLQQAERWSAGRRFINAYGPSEATVCASMGTYVPGQGRLHIGKPMQNVQLYVLSEQGAVLPLGVAGELYVGGVGLSRGYLNRPELTAEKFVANPFHDPSDPSSSERLYRTGDLVRWLDDGNLEFLGRIDQQVKIRGFRIELGEIEAALTAHAEVRDAVVLARQSTAGDKRLVAYVVGTADAEALRRHLAASLPDYMVPSAFVALEALPLTPNGKVDRKALPDADLSAVQAEYVAPRTPTEEALCAIWQDLLGIDRIGTADNFFQLGGHSLLVMRMIARLQEYGLVLQARQLFQAPVLADLAAAIDAGAGAAPAFRAPPRGIPDGCQYITPDMLPLATLTQDEIDAVASRVPGGAANIEDINALAPLQEGILFHHMMASGGDPYVLPTLSVMRDRATLENFLGALRFMISRHDMMRTAVLWEGLSAPVQVVCRRAELPLHWLQLDPSRDAQEQMQALCAPEKQRIDLTQAPMLRVQVAADPRSERYFLLLQFHHLMADHVALEIIEREAALFAAGHPDLLPPVVPYREFVAHALHQARNSDADAYFSAKLGDVDEPCVPFNLTDVKGDGSGIDEVRANIAPQLADAIRRLARERTVSPAAVFHAAWAMVVAAACGRDDVVFGTVLSGRLQGTLGSEQMLGMFINTLPLRARLQGSSAMQLIGQMHAELLSLLPYEQTPLARAQRCSGVASGQPLFSAMLNFRHSASTPSSDIDTGIETIGGQERTNYPFNISVDDFGDSFGLDVQVDASVGAQRVLAYVQAALESLVRAALAGDAGGAALLPVLPPDERQRLLREFNASAAAYPADQCIHTLFERRARSAPDAVALVLGDFQMSYRELDEQANRLAHWLRREKNVGPDRLVGVCMARSPDMLVAMLAILKAGGAYVPLDPTYPAQRLAYMLADAQLDVVLTHGALLESVPFGAAQAICLDDMVLQAALSALPASAPEVPGLAAHHLAYAIYTSGSTGNPKASLLAHSGLCNLAVAQAQAFDVHPGDRMLQFASVAFDAATSEWSVALSQGATLVMIDAETALSPDRLSAEVQRRGVTHATLTPALLPLLPIEAWQQVRTLVTAGDACSLQQAERWSAGRRFINAYGPSEATVCASMGTYVPGQGRLHIGKPMQNVQLYVLSEQGAVLPLGVAGELYVGGVGLSRGYLNRPELTAEKFVANPFHDPSDPSSSERLYRTGDLVRWLDDGNLEFLGRIDQQVKIRGFRIELGEIEAALTAHAEVRDAVVLARQSAAGDKRLVAYVVGTADAEALRGHLAASLPDYMVPSAFVALEALPLTPNGKVDRKALPDADLSAVQAAYIAPRTPTEEALCAIWQEILGLERIGAADNFFQLGGHSLLVMRLVAAVKTTFDVELPIRVLFDIQDVQGMAAYLDVSRPVDVSGEEMESFEL